MNEIEVKETDLPEKVASIVVEEDASMRPMIVTEDDRLTKQDIEVHAWKNADSFLLYTKRALAAVPGYSEQSPNSLKRAITYYDALLAEMEEAIEKDAQFSDFNEVQIKQLDEIDNLVVAARNELVTKLGKIAEGDVKRQSLVKIATTPNNLVYTVDPFLKAIAMTCINAKIQGGKDIEEVYQSLKKEYKLDKREDLAILQILKDSGYPVRHSMMADSGDMIQQFYS